MQKASLYHWQQRPCHHLHCRTPQRIWGNQQRDVESLWKGRATSLTECCTYSSLTWWFWWQEFPLVGDRQDLVICTTLWTMRWSLMSSFQTRQYSMLYSSLIVCILHIGHILYLTMYRGLCCHSSRALEMLLAPIWRPYSNAPLSVTHFWSRTEHFCGMHCINLLSLQPS